MQGEFWIANSQHRLESTINHLRAMFAEHKYLKVQFKIGKQRTVEQNAMYWEWMAILAEFFTVKMKQPYAKEDMHDLMRHKFLGYDTKTIGQTEISKLRSTTKLTTGEEFAYMEQIDAWSAEFGCLLPRPDSSDYQQNKNKVVE